MERWKMVGGWLGVALLVAACGSRTPQPVATTPVEPTRVTDEGGEATLLLLADVRGVLRPCGCTPELQKGGFDRLVPVLAQERASAGPGASLVLHAGPMFHEELDADSRKRAQHIRQAEVASGLFEMARVDVVSAHPLDAAPDVGAWQHLAKRAGGDVVAANISGLPAGVSRWEVRQVGGLAIGIFALAPQSDVPDGWKVSDPRTAAQEAVAALRDRSDAVILLSGLGLRETRRLLRNFEGIDFALVGGMGEHPAVSEEAELVGQARLLQLHREGRYLGRLVLKRHRGDVRPYADGSVASPSELAALESRIARLAEQITKLAALEDDGGTANRTLVGLRHQHASLEAELARVKARQDSVPKGTASFAFRAISVDWDLPQADAPLAVMTAFDKELAEINIANAGTLPKAAPGQAVYVGVDACLECHAETQTFWDTTRHSHAWETLEKVNKTFDAGCVSCHVTGYEQPGGSLVGQTAGREDVQCESCHGPGSNHVADGKASSIVRAPKADACVGCHNTHHSPSFDFEPYRAQLLVPGHGRPLAK